MPESERVWRVVQAERTAWPCEFKSDATEFYEARVKAADALGFHPQCSVSHYVQRYDRAAGRWLTVRKTERTPPLADDPSTVPRSVGLVIEAMAEPPAVSYAEPKKV